MPHEWKGLFSVRTATDHIIEKPLVLITEDPDIGDTHPEVAWISVRRMQHILRGQDILISWAAAVTDLQRTQAD